MCQIYVRHITNSSLANFRGSRKIKLRISWGPNFLYYSKCFASWFRMILMRIRNTRYRYGYSHSFFLFDQGLNETCIISKIIAREDLDKHINGSRKNYKDSKTFFRESDSRVGDV